ncbi:MAG: hypothetical protein ACI4AQ_06630 [Lachnospiraceae bacterium]
MDDFRIPDESFFRQNTIRLNNALIQNVSQNRGTTFVTITQNNCPRCQNQNQQITLVVNRDTRIRDERGNPLPAGALEPGMVIDAIISEAMTRSIPPQAQAFQIRVQARPQPFDTTYGRIMEVNTRNSYIQTISNINPASIIRFNISPDTRILDPLGRPIPLSRLFPGLRVRVRHATFMTASIPPQTTAFVIQIIR